MRRRFAVSAAVVFVAVATASAQIMSNQQASTALTGVNPHKINFVPVDTSKALVPMNIANSFRPARPPQTFTLSNMFPKITVAPWPLKMPSLFHRPNLTSTPINPQTALRR